MDRTLGFDTSFPAPARDPWEWFNRSERAIAHGALTNSKRPSSFVKGVYPTHLEDGHGCHVRGTCPVKNEKVRYLDFIGANGTNLLGYGNEMLARKIRKRFVDGALLSLGTTLEVETAEKFKSAVPMIQSLRFLKTGSEACIAAITIARAYTGRAEVLSDGYHGWINEYTSLTPPHNGVPNEFGTNIRKFESLAQITEKTAAVIIEPVNLDASKERFDFLQALRDRCTDTGTVLIYDEVITGFRVPKYTVAHWTGVRPDLICLGKAIGGGLSLSIVGGSKAIMECKDEYFVSSTFAGETLALTTAKEFVDIMLTKRKIEDLWESGERFIEKFNSISPENIRLKGYPTRAVFEGDPKFKGLLFQEACLAGILLGPSWFYSFPHMDSENVLPILEEIIWRIKTQKVLLKGELPRSPFAQKVRSK